MIQGIHYATMSNPEFQEGFRLYKSAEESLARVQSEIDHLITQAQPIPDALTDVLKKRRTERDRLRNPLLVANMRLVFKLCEAYKWRGTDSNDITQEAVFGLIRALELYEPERGCFSTYANWWIRSYATRGAQRQSNRRIMRVSISQQALEYTLKNDIETFEKKHGVCPSNEELRRFTKRPRIAKLDQAKLDHLRANPITGAASSRSEYEDRAATPEAIVSAKQRFVYLREIIAKVTISPAPRTILVERNDRIMKLRYGLSEGASTMKLVEIGDKYGLTRERVRQIILQRVTLHDLTLEKFDAMVESMFDLMEVLSD